MMGEYIGIETELKDDNYMKTPSALILDTYTLKIKMQCGNN